MAKMAVSIPGGMPDIDRTSDTNGMPDTDGTFDTDESPDTDGTSDTDESPDTHKMPDTGPTNGTVARVGTQYDGYPLLSPDAAAHAKMLASTPSDSGVGGQLLGYTDRSSSR